MDDIILSQSTMVYLLCRRSVVYLCVSSTSEKTLAETVHYIPKGLRKGNPFMDLLLNSHICTSHLTRIMYVRLLLATICSVWTSNVYIAHFCFPQPSSSSQGATSIKKAWTEPDILILKIWQNINRIYSVLQDQDYSEKQFQKVFELSSPKESGHRSVPRKPILSLNTWFNKNCNYQTPSSWIDVAGYLLHVVIKWQIPPTFHRVSINLPALLPIGICLRYIPSSFQDMQFQILHMLQDALGLRTMRCKMAAADSFVFKQLKAVLNKSVFTFTYRGREHLLRVVPTSLCRSSRPLPSPTPERTPRGSLCTTGHFPLHCCLLSVKHVIGFSLFSVSNFFWMESGMSHGRWLKSTPESPSMTPCMSSCRYHETSWGFAVATCRSRKSCHPAGSLPTPNLPRHLRFLKMDEDGSSPKKLKHDGGTPRQGSCGVKSWCSPSLPHLGVDDGRSSQVQSPFTDEEF